MSERRSVVRWLALGFMALGGLVFVSGVVQWLAGQQASTPLLTPTPTVVKVLSSPTHPAPTSALDPLIPTRTPRPLALASTTPSPQAPALPLASATPGVLLPTGTATAVDEPTPQPDAPMPPAADESDDLWVPPEERFRLGVSLPYAAQPQQLAALKVGWVMDWQVRFSPSHGDNVAHAQTVRMGGGVLRPDAETLTTAAAARPGALWLISNEPDVRWQDNVTAQVYAQLYYEAYQAIKAGDPRAVVAAGGIAQPSPLRLRYLDIVLETYQQSFGVPLPADAWHIHNYMLREERDSWGVDIPPGMPDSIGMLYEIDDSGNVSMFRSQIYAFRQWMQAQGYGGLPLVVSEFGIPMPPDYGFPPERVQTFLRETTRFFLTATDPALGDPDDGGRLVQKWCWYSITEPAYPAGELLTLETATWTPVGQAWMEMVAD